MRRTPVAYISGFIEEENYEQVAYFKAPQNVQQKLNHLFIQNTKIHISVTPNCNK